MTIDGSPKIYSRHTGGGEWSAGCLNSYGTVIEFSFSCLKTGKNTTAPANKYVSETMPKVLCKPHYGNSHLEMVV